jgi:hypothetical protein
MSAAFTLRTNSASSKPRKSTPSQPASGWASGPLPETPFSRELMRMENDCNVSDDVLEQKGVGALRRAVQEGDAENGC